MTQSVPGAHPGAGRPAVELPALSEVATQYPGRQAVSVAAQVFSALRCQAEILLEPVAQAGKMLLLVTDWPSNLMA